MARDNSPGLPPSLWSFHPLWGAEAFVFCSSLVDGLITCSPQVPQSHLLLNRHPVQRVQISGTVTNLKRKDAYHVYFVDDGTGEPAQVIAQTRTFTGEPSEMYSPGIGDRVMVAGMLQWGYLRVGSGNVRVRELCACRVHLLPSVGAMESHWKETCHLWNTVYKRPLADLLPAWIAVAYLAFDRTYTLGSPQASLRGQDQEAPVPPPDRALTILEAMSADPVHVQASKIIQRFGLRPALHTQLAAFSSESDAGLAGPTWKRKIAAHRQAEAGLHASLLIALVTRIFRECHSYGRGESHADAEASTKRAIALASRVEVERAQGVLSDEDEAAWAEMVTGLTVIDSEDDGLDYLNLSNDENSDSDQHDDPGDVVDDDLQPRKRARGLAPGGLAPGVSGVGSLPPNALLLKASDDLKNEKVRSVVSTMLNSRGWVFSEMPLSAELVGDDGMFGQGSVREACEDACESDSGATIPEVRSEAVAPKPQAEYRTSEVVVSPANQYAAPRLPVLFTSADVLDVLDECARDIACALRQHCSLPGAGGSLAGHPDERVWMFIQESLTSLKADGAVFAISRSFNSSRAEAAPWHIKYWEERNAAASAGSSSATSASASPFRSQLILFGLVTFGDVLMPALWIAVQHAVAMGHKGKGERRHHALVKGAAAKESDVMSVDERVVHQAASDLTTGSAKMYVTRSAVIKRFKERFADLSNVGTDTLQEALGRLEDKAYIALAEPIADGGNRNKKSADPTYVVSYHDPVVTMTESP